MGRIWLFIPIKTTWRKREQNALPVKPSHPKPAITPSACKIAGKAKPRYSHAFLSFNTLNSALFSHSPPKLLPSHTHNQKIKFHRSKMQVTLHTCEALLLLLNISDHVFLVSRRFKVSVSPCNVSCVCVFHFSLWLSVSLPLTVNFGFSRSPTGMDC